MDLLKNYGSSSDDDEKNNSKKIKINEKGNKAKIKLPLPHDFKSEVADKPLIDENGKKRRFAHVDGNWPSLIYIPINANNIFIQNKAKYVIDTINRFNEGKKHLKLLSEELEYDGNFHISLSKSFVLRKHQIKPFVDSIRSNFSLYKSFHINFSGYTLFNNEDNSRSFASFYISKGAKDICDLISSVDKVMKLYSQPIYYDPAIPHMSVASCPDKLEWEEIDEDWDDLSNNFGIEEIICKIGNKIFNIPLK